MATATELLQRSGIDVVDVLSRPLRCKKKTNADILAAGDVVEFVSTSDRTIQLFGTAVGSLPCVSDSFLGICLDDNPGTDQVNLPIISVAYHCVIRAKVTAAAVKCGAALKVSIGPLKAEKNAGTYVDWVFVAAAGEGVAWALEDIAASGTGLILIDTRVASSMASNIFAFETVTS